MRVRVRGGREGESEGEEKVRVRGREKVRVRGRR